MCLRQKLSPKQCPPASLVSGGMSTEGVQTSLKPSRPLLSNIFRKLSERSCKGMALTTMMMPSPRLSLVTSSLAINDPRERLGPMAENFLCNHTPHNHIKFDEDTFPNTSTVYRIATQASAPTGIVHTDTANALCCG